MLGRDKIGDTNLPVALLASRTDQIALKLVCNGWVSAQHNPASLAHRTLGVQLSEITMRAKDAGERVFQANTGEWK
jgi:hypothetical protein